MMETLQPTLKNGRNVWDKINMPEEEFRERIKKIRRKMKKDGIEILLIYGYGLNEYGNYCYLSNFIIRLPRGALLILPLREEPCLIFEGASRGIPSFKKMTWVEELRAAGDVSKECLNYLKEKNLIPSTIGFVGIYELMPYGQVKFLSESLGQSKIVGADYIIKEIRMVKSQKEIDQIRRSSRIISMCFKFITEIKLNKPNEKMLEALIYREARLEGAEDVRIMIAKPKENVWAFRPIEDLEIYPGETIILNLSIEFERYWAEASRTFILNDHLLSESRSDRFYSLYEKILKKLRPKKEISQFYKEMMFEIENEGLVPILDFGVGEAIGLSLKEAPFITEEETNSFKEGMTFSLRLLTRDEDLGARMLGNTVSINKNRTEILTS